MSFKGAAETVVAYLFRLLYGDGVAAADFTTNLSGGNNGAIRFHHVDGNTDSVLLWSRAATASDDYLQLSGPSGRTLFTMQSDLVGDDSVTINAGSLFSVSQGITLAPVTNLQLGTRTARMLVDYSSIGGNGAPTTLPVGGPYTLLNGVTTPAMALIAGDIVVVIGSADIAAGSTGGIAQVAVHVNGAQLSLPAAMEVPAGQRITINTHVAIYTIPATGNYTFDLRGYTFGAAPAFSSNNGSSVITVQVFATK